MLYRGGNGDLGVVGGGRWRVYVRPCYVPSAVCVCVCDLGVREVSPLAVCLGRPTSLPGLQPAPYHGSWSFNVSIVTE